MPRQKIEGPRPELEALKNYKRIFVREMLGVSFKTLKEWEPAMIGAGVINEDGTFNLIHLCRWLTNRRTESGTDDRGSLELEKLKKEIEFKDSQIQKNLRNTMDRSLHDQIEVSRIATLKNFLSGSFVQNVHRFYGKTIDELKVIAMDFVRQAMDAYTGADSEIEDLVEKEEEEQPTEKKKRKRS